LWSWVDAGLKPGAYTPLHGGPARWDALKRAPTFIAPHFIGGSEKFWAASWAVG